MCSLGIRPPAQVCIGDLAGGHTAGLAFAMYSLVGVDIGDTSDVHFGCVDVRSRVVPWAVLDAFATRRLSVATPVTPARSYLRR